VDRHTKLAFKNGNEPLAQLDRNGIGDPNPANSPEEMRKIDRGAH
jgi:hypothetical protein